MSTEPSPTPETQRPTQTPTEIAARGRTDPWASSDEQDGGERLAARAPRQFEPYSIARLRNLMDEANAYCS